MSLETANPAIVLLLLLPFVVLCLLLICGALSYWWKHKEDEEIDVCDTCSEDPETCGDQCSE